MAVFCGGCFEDESNLDIKQLNPIRIENIDLNQKGFSLYMGDTLKIEPLVFCEGIPDAKLSFEWELSGGTIPPRIIDSTMYLSAEIMAPPYSTNGGYFLRYTITDETTGISRIETFNVEVLSRYGEGILIADTKDGLNSDISLVMSREVTSGIDKSNAKVNIFRNLWSQGNGAPLSGIILDAVTSVYGSNRSLTVLTDKHIQRADNIDFINIPDEMDELLFGNVVPPHIGHGYKDGVFVVNTIWKDEVLAVNGKVTTRGVQNNGRLFGYTLYPSGVTDYYVNLMYAPDRYPTYAYDRLGKRMLFFGAGKHWAPQEQGSGSQFNVCDLSAYEPFYLAETSAGVTLLAKEIGTGAYKGLVMNKLNDNGANYAKTMFDFSSAAEIDKAKYFELNQKEDVVYYATDTKVYATPTANIDARVQWEVPVNSGDKITGIKIYKWGGGQRRHSVDNNGEVGEVFWNSQNGMIMISTYNEVTKEGKVTLVPIVTFGIGGLEQNREFQVVLSGFGKILGIYKQHK